MDKRAPEPLAVTHVAPVRVPLPAPAPAPTLAPRTRRRLKAHNLRIRMCCNDTTTNVGLLIEYVDLGELKLADAAIMHAAVPARAFKAIVRKNATAAQLSNAFQVPEPVITAVWLAEPNTSSQTNTSTRRNSTNTRQELHPRANRTRHHPKPDYDAVRDLAATLAGKLEALAAANSAANSKQAGADTCGFGAHHNHLRVLGGGYGVVKERDSLYKTAHAKHPAPDNVNFYFEVVVVSDEHAGGICVGVGTENAPLEKLVGSHEAVGMHSSGQLVRSGGQFEEYGVSFRTGDRVGVLVVRPKPKDTPPPAQSESQAEPQTEPQAPPSALTENCEMKNENLLQITFFVNGQRQQTISQAIGTNFNQPIFPVVSLYRRRSRVLLRCSQNDWNVDREVLDEICPDVQSIC